MAEPGRSNLPAADVGRLRTFVDLRGGTGDRRGPRGREDAISPHSPHILHRPTLLRPVHALAFVPLSSSVDELVLLSHLSACAHAAASAAMKSATWSIASDVWYSSSWAAIVAEAVGAGVGAGVGAASAGAQAR